MKCSRILKKKYTKRKLLLIMHQKTSILIYHLKFKNSLFKLFKAGRPQVSLKKVSLRGVPACHPYVMLSCTWVFKHFYQIRDAGTPLWHFSNSIYFIFTFFVVCFFLLIMQLSPGVPSLTDFLLFLLYNSLNHTIKQKGHLQGHLI